MKENPYGSKQCGHPAECPYKNQSIRLKADGAACPACGCAFSPMPRQAAVVRWNRVFGAIFLLAAAGLAAWHFFGDGTSPIDRLGNTNPAEKTEAAAETETGDEACLEKPANRSNVLPEIRRRGVKIVVESDAPPFNEEVGGRSTGFDYEVATELAKRLGVPKVEMVYASGDDYGIFPCYLHDGRADWIMGGYVPTAKFDRLVSWTDSYYPENGYCLIVKKGSGIKNVRDLAGKKVGVYDEDAVVAWVRETAQATPVRFTDAGPVEGKAFAPGDQDQGKWMLLAMYDYGMDAIVYDYPFAAAELKNAQGKLKIVEYNLGSLPYSIGIPSGNEDLLDAVNQALKSFMQTPAYGNLVRKFIPKPQESEEDIPLPRKGVRQHVVRSGETMSGIVAAELGDVNLWPRVWEWNKSRIPNPHLIEPGDVILLEKGN
jgi:polar amino acid transport system substrate-binding protein